MWCRNPLFIKSEFSRRDTELGEPTSIWSRNPLFIKSEFSLYYTSPVTGEVVIFDVAILYSSSQNSLFRTRDLCSIKSCLSQSFIHQVRILSQILRACQRAVSWVAILYSSSQNSLIQRTKHNSALFTESQSFIHQVRILSSKGI